MQIYLLICIMYNEYLLKITSQALLKFLDILTFMMYSKVVAWAHSVPKANYYSFKLNKKRPVPQQTT